MSNESLYWSKKIRKFFPLFFWMLLYFASTDNFYNITYMMWLLNMFPKATSILFFMWPEAQYLLTSITTGISTEPVFAFLLLQSVQTHISVYISITQWLISLISKIFLICFPRPFHIKYTYLFQAHPVKMEWVSSSVAHGALGCVTETFLLPDQYLRVVYVCSTMAHRTLVYERDAFLLSDKPHWSSDLLQTNFS